MIINKGEGAMNLEGDSPGFGSVYHDPSAWFRPADKNPRLADCVRPTLALFIIVAMPNGAAVTMGAFNL